MCTEFMLPQSTDFLVSGRTMDFAINFDWQVAAVPVGTELTAIAFPLFTNPGLAWQAKYGFLGISNKLPAGLFDTRVADALNTEGLSAAALWLPGSEYPNPKQAPKSAKLLSAMDICSWAASNYATVAKLRADLEAIQNGAPTASGELIAFWDPLQFGGELSNTYGNEVTNHLPLHFQFHDKVGESLVLEFRNGELQLTDNSDLGVMTNAPFIDWQRTNLSNYLNVTNLETEQKKIVGLDVEKAGNGGGFIGLSYSALPADRFARTAMTLNFSIPWLMTECGSYNDAVAYTQRVIGGIAVVRGQCVDPGKKVYGDYTQWNVTRNHANPALHISTAESLGSWTVNFSDYKLNKGSKPQFVTIPNATDMPTLKP